MSVILCILLCAGVCQSTTTSSNFIKMVLTYNNMTSSQYSIYSNLLLKSTVHIPDGQYCHLRDAIKSSLRIDGTDARKFDEQAKNLRKSVLSLLFLGADRINVHEFGKIFIDIQSFLVNLCAKDASVFMLTNYLFPDVYCYRNTGTPSGTAPDLLIKAPNFSLTEFNLPLQEYVHKIYTAVHCLSYASNEKMLIESPFGIGSEYILAIHEFTKWSTCVQDILYPLFIEISNYDLRKHEASLRSMSKVLSNDKKYREFYSEQISRTPISAYLYKKDIKSDKVEFFKNGWYEIYWKRCNGLCYPSLPLLKADIDHTFEKWSIKDKNYTWDEITLNIERMVRSGGFAKIPMELIFVILSFLENNGGFESLRLTCHFFSWLPKNVNISPEQRTEKACSELFFPLSSLESFLFVAARRISKITSEPKRNDLAQSVALFVRKSYMCIGLDPFRFLNSKTQGWEDQIDVLHILKEIQARVQRPRDFLGDRKTKNSST